MLSVSWLFILGGFMIAGWVASRAAQTAQTLPAQYAALAGYVVIESLIFLPLLVVANHVAPGAISSAGLVTILGFAALTGIAFYTRKDFSFLRGALMWGGVGAMLLVIGGVVFGFQLGMFFSVAMVVFAGAAILYDTSNVVHHFPEDRYVAASLQLFSSVTLMFWYVLRIFMSRR
jgi:FtsH-binding integral membrane protein